MKSSDKIVMEVHKNESIALVLNFEEFLKAKGLRLGWYETLTLAEYLLYKNNKFRKHDRAIISFRKVKK